MPPNHLFAPKENIWAAPSEFGTYRLCEQRRFRRACASAQSRQNLRCSLIQAVSQEEPSDRKPDPWPLWMSGHAQLNFVMTDCSKTQIRLTGLIYHLSLWSLVGTKLLHYTKCQSRKREIIQLNIKNNLPIVNQVILVYAKYHDPSPTCSPDILLTRFHRFH